MIDREARNKAAEIVRHFVTGQLYNFDFQDGEPKTKDAVIPAIWESLWPSYCDLRKHKMNKEWSLSKEGKHAISIWLLFLYSNEEYAWPKISYPGVRPQKYSFLSKFIGMHKRQEKFMLSGEYSVWPFINMESYENAKKNHKLLAGS